MGASDFGQSRLRSRFLLFGMLFLLLSPVAFVAARSFVTLTIRRRRSVARKS